MNCDMEKKTLFAKAKRIPPELIRQIQRGYVSLN